MPGFDRTAFIHHFLRQMERDMGLPLAWMAANHYDTAHPHTHVLVRGVSQGEDLYMKPGYFKHGLREQASRVLTAFVGPVREQEQTRQPRAVSAVPAEPGPGTATAQRCHPGE